MAAELSRAKTVEQQLNAELLRTNARLETERQRLEIVFESLPDAALVVDAEGVVVLANGPARRLLGEHYRPGFALSAPGAPPPPPHYQAGAAVPPEALPLRRALREGDATLDYEVTIESPAAGLRHALVSAVPVRGRDGTPLGAIGLLRDVTERHELERLKDQFIARASHELRTPLTAIRGTLRFLVRALDGRAAEPPKELLTIAGRNVEHMVRLVEDLLDASRLASGRVALVRENVAVRELIEQIAQQLAPVARDRGVTLAIAADPGLAVEADPLKLEQVVTNLAGNALKFTPEGGRVTIEARAPGGEIEIAVRDTGLGLAPEHLGRVFEPFFQVAAPARRGRAGSGLGLSIAKSLVEMHGGRIWAESDGPGRGATFRVSLPSRAVEPRVA
jgi:signal transduction histidine kinase